MSPEYNDHKLVFVGGLHRSGTSVLSRCLREHPLISGFRDTGVPEDEGQHLQSVYPPASFYGGPGEFGFRREVRLTEASPLASEENAGRLFSEWSRYWDTTKPFLLEKSPPNLLRTRFLQRLFPDSYFIIIIRHPVAVSLATQKWNNSGLDSLLRHWIVCHKLFQSDAPCLNHLLIVNYEHFVAQPSSTLEAVCSFLGVNSHPLAIKVRPSVNQVYFAEWSQLRLGLVSKLRICYLTLKYEKQVNRFGYSLLDLSSVTPAEQLVKWQLQ